MSDHHSGLPERPSLERLRKLAKARLKALRAQAPDTKLAEAQHGLATELGFASWPTMVRHVRGVLEGGRRGLFERLADDLLAGAAGDAEALDRLIGHFGASYDPDQMRTRVRRRIAAVRDDATADGATRADVRLLVARQYGFEDWAELASSLTGEETPGAPAVGPGTRATFYRVVDGGRTIEVRPPLRTRDWATVFEVMKERSIEGLRSPAVTDDAMKGLAGLPFVRRVDVGGARTLTDDGLLELAALPALEELSIGGSHMRITDRGLAVLRHLHGLRRFEASWAVRVTDVGLAHLEGCRGLRRVDLMGTKTGDGALAALREMPELDNVATGRQVTDDGLAHLRTYPRFVQPSEEPVELGLMSFGLEHGRLLLDGPVTDRGLMRLSGLDGLRGLTLFRHAAHVGAAGLRTLRDLPGLEFLGVPGDRCDDDAMAAVATLPRLRMLLAQGAVASDRGFAALGASSTLEYLWGRECPHLTGAGFAALAEVPTLRGLGVSCARVDGASLGALGSFPALDELMPMDVGDEGFHHVAQCARLERLWCMYCRDTTDRATVHVRDLPLRSYYAGRTRITDRSLEVLATMRSLEGIELWGIAGITDTGIRRLVELPHLREISVGESPGVSPAAMARFGPEVRVVHDA